MAKAWLFGTNTRLDDEAPIEVLGQATETAQLAPCRPRCQAVRELSVTGAGGRAHWRVGNHAGRSPNLGDQQHVLVEARAHIEGPVVDLCDGDFRHDVERRHAALLEAHGMDHPTFRNNGPAPAVTQAIAADLHDRVGAAGVRFPSRLDGNPCLALLEGRSTFALVGDPILLVDPASEALRIVCDGWRLDLSPASARAEPG